jgi:hypothetical protein
MAKHNLATRVGNRKRKQETIDFNVLVNVFKIEPSSLTYAMPLSSKSYESNIIVHKATMIANML